MNINNQEIIDMLKKYYKTHEEKEVEVQIHCGRVRTKEKYATPMGTVQIDVFQNAFVDGEIIKRPIPVDLDDMYRMISVVLLDDGFRVDDITLVVNPNDATLFEGVKVTGEKVQEQEKSI